VRTRPTVTRFVALRAPPAVPALAALASQKKVDERELYLIVDGPEFQWAVKADAKHVQQVRAFVAQVSTAARRPSHG
jgi:hypothetical protein